MVRYLGAFLLYWFLALDTRNQVFFLEEVTVLCVTIDFLGWIYSRYFRIFFFEGNVDIARRKYPQCMSLLRYLHPSCDLYLQ